MPQNNEQATYWRKRDEKDGIIDWRMSAETIRNLVRALSAPYPGASFVTGEGQVKVGRADVVAKVNRHLEPGRILLVEGTSLVVMAADQPIRVSSLSPHPKVEAGMYL